MRKWLPGFALIVCLCAWRAISAPSPKDDKPLTADEVAAAYKSYQQITKTMVAVNPELATLCVGVRKQIADETHVQHGPHGNTSILIYMNDPAAAVFRAKGAVYPPDAVVVKEKHVGYYINDAGKSTPDGHDGVGGMIKRAAGYDSEHGDWEYFYFEQSAPVTSADTVKPLPKVESGRIASCVQCHAAAKPTDYVFGSWAHQTDPHRSSPV